MLLDYWLAQNPQQRHVWPGLFTSQVASGKAGAWPAREIVDQLGVLRTRPAAGGHIHFSLMALQQDREGLATSLQKGLYAQAALVPATPWLQAPAVAAPLLRVAAGRVRIEPAAGAQPVRWAVWRRVGGANGTWHFSALPPPDRVVEPAGADLVVVQAVNRLGLLSERAMIRLP